MTYTNLKSIILSKNLLWQYQDNGDHYSIFAVDSIIRYDAMLYKIGQEPDGLDVAQNTSDVNDFLANYQPTANGKVTLSPAQLDTDGATLSRVKVAPTGWNFNYRMIEIQLATVDGISNLDVNGLDVKDATIKIYDGNNVLITDPALQGTAVKTVVDLEPPYNVCVAGGCLRMDTHPVSDVILNVVAVPDIPAIYGGSKVFIQNVNLSYIDGSIGLNADGRAAKQLNYNPVLHTNRFRFQFTHEAGYQFWCAILMEIYKQ